MSPARKSLARLSEQGRVRQIGVVDGGSSRRAPSSGIVRRRQARRREEPRTKAAPPAGHHGDRGRRPAAVAAPCRGPKPAAPASPGPAGCPSGRQRQTAPPALRPRPAPGPGPDPSPPHRDPARRQQPVLLAAAVGARYPARWALRPPPAPRPADPSRRRSASTPGNMPPRRPVQVHQAVQNVRGSRPGGGPRPGRRRSGPVAAAVYRGGASAVPPRSRARFRAARWRRWRRSSRSARWRGRRVQPSGGAPKQAASRSGRNAPSTNMQAPVVGGVRLPHGNGGPIRLARGASLSDFAEDQRQPGLAGAGAVQPRRDGDNHPVGG